MTDRSKTCGPTISPDTGSVISSPVSPDGRSPSPSPDGPKTEKYGRAHHRARTIQSGVPCGACAPVSQEIAAALRRLGPIWSAEFGRELCSSKTFREQRNGLPRSRAVWRLLATLYPDRSFRLQLLAHLICVGACGWLPTVTARDYKNVGLPDHKRLRASRGEPLPETIGAQLPAEIACWLMGYPAEWTQCAPMATPSSRKSRRNS